MDRGPPQKLSDDGWGSDAEEDNVCAFYPASSMSPERQPLSHMDGAAIGDRAFSVAASRA